MWLAIACALLTALACGLWNGLLVAKIGLQPIIATLILMVGGPRRGAAVNGRSDRHCLLPAVFLHRQWLSVGPALCAVHRGLSFSGCCNWSVSRTALGLFIQAIGINPAAARLAGVRERLITICVYAFCGLTAGIAGLIISSNVKSADGNNAGNLLELDAILAVTLGGTLLTGGRFTSGRQHDWRADHPDADIDHLFHRSSTRDQLGSQGGRGCLVVRCCCSPQHFRRKPCATGPCGQLPGVRHVKLTRANTFHWLRPSRCLRQCPVYGAVSYTGFLVCRRCF